MFLPGCLTIAAAGGLILNEQIVPEFSRKDRFFDVLDGWEREALLLRTAGIRLKNNRGEVLGLAIIGNAPEERVMPFCQHNE